MIPFFPAGPLFYSYTLLLRISNFLDLSITEEILLVEMRIWCIKIGNLLVLHLTLTEMADWQLHYTSNVRTLTLQSSTFLFYVVTYHFHLLMVCTSPSWFDTQAHVLRMRKWGNLLTKKLMLQGYQYNESRLRSSFRKFYVRYNDLVCDYKLSLAHMLNDLLHTIC
jgi:hypothetical protein